MSLYVIQIARNLLSNFGPILHRFWDMASYRPKIVNFSYPTLVWRPRLGEPFLISGWNLRSKN